MSGFILASKIRMSILINRKCIYTAEIMHGLSDETNKVFDSVSKLNYIKDFILISGTSLALQTGHMVEEFWSKGQNNESLNMPGKNLLLS
jgi:hypothetical protein